MSAKNTLSLYACGGTAANIAKELFHPSCPRPNEDGFALISTYFIDTSDSNITKDIVNTGNFFHIAGTESEPINGSGMIRRANHAAIARAIPEITHAFKPGSLNVVLHSASGGSGSVIGPELVSELLSAGEAVVVITIGSTTCKKELTNTLDTLASYQSIAQKRAMPVMVSYLENGFKTMRMNNEEVRLQILMLAAIWSGENHGMDTADLFNFINYNRPAPEFCPALTRLNFKIDADPEYQYPKGESVAAILTMVKEGQDADPRMTVGYHTFGQFSDAAAEVISLQTDQPVSLHAVQGAFTSVVAALNSKKTSLEENHRANQPVLFSVDPDNAEDSGIVL